MNVDPREQQASAGDHESGGGAVGFSGGGFPGMGFGGTGDMNQMQMMMALQNGMASFPMMGQFPFLALCRLVPCTVC